MKNYIKKKYPILICAVTATVAFALNNESVINALCCGWCCGIAFVDTLNYHFRNK